MASSVGLALIFVNLLRNRVYQAHSRSRFYFDANKEVNISAARLTNPNLMQPYVHRMAWWWASGGRCHKKPPG